MGKIIVGYDGRDVSNDALALGRRLAGDYGDELIVAATYGFEQSSDGGPGGYFERRKRYFDKTFALAAGQIGETPFSAQAIDDLPARGLYMLAESEGARMIVVGSTTRGRLGRALVGSTGETLLGSAPCAVAVAPRGYARSEHPALGLVGVGFDGQPESGRAVREAAELAELMDADLQVISVGPVHHLTLSPHGPVEMREEDLRQRLQEALEGLPAERVQFVPDSGDAAEALARHGVELDLLIVGSRGYGPLRRTLLGSTGAALVRTAPCPVLVVPRGDEENDLADSGAVETTA